MLAVAAAMAHVLARALAPWLFLPERYVMYPVPVLVVVLVPAGAVALGDLLARAGRRRPGVAGPVPGDRSRARRADPPPRLAGAALALAIAALTGGPVSPDLGYTVRVPAETGLYRVIAALPPDAVVAGWPTGPIDSAPYLARRRALLTFETHQALHRGHTEEMRRRGRALIDAYFATAWRPVAALRDGFGVTHLLLDRRHLRGRPPDYFAPFDTWIAEAWSRGQRAGFVLAQPPAGMTALAEGDLVLLDLGRLPP
jgi:hypothetical protein